MLNGMERAREKQLPESDRRRPQPSAREDSQGDDASPDGFH